MGIKNFSQIFKGKEVKLNNLKGLTACIDASVIAYQSALGMKNINALTDADGNPTIHINVVIAKCLNFYKCGIGQVWVFDFHEKGYVNPNKAIELKKRKKVRDNANKKLAELREKKDNDLFSSDEDEEETHIESKIQTQERMGFSMNGAIINDIKFILDCFNIMWCDSPKGFESESICASLTNDTKGGAFCDLVWTTDTDAIIYGAKQIVRELKIKQKKVMMSYELDNILEDNDISIDDLRKIAVVAGCDHCEKTPKIGPKTILKKFKDVELTDKQKQATQVFQKKYDISKLKWNNDNNDNFADVHKITKLLDWLESKNFNRNRIKKQIDKALE